MAVLAERTATQPDGGPEMIWIGGGTFLMGSDSHYPEEAPAHRVSVAGFRMDATTVTNADFAAFVAHSGYVTLAERPLDPQQFSGADPAMLKPGGLVFRKARRPVDLSDFRNWWSYMPGACWRHPEGPGSSIAGRLDHPVVQVAFEDAVAYAKWAGKELPTEAEWEFAARGGLDGAEFPWGNELTPEGRYLANTWQGEFPWQNLRHDGFAGCAPVKSYPPNGYGLFEMTGNVWEWTSDFFTPRHRDNSPACCVPHDPRVETPEHSYDRAQPDTHIPRRVVKGGSFLCAPDYCLRYRPAARQGQAIETSSNHIGFRCVTRAP
jgi:formylglycine-generating enzyme